jgi:hypothetical protein
MHIVGATDLVVEMDVQYVCGMLNNPDIQPNAAINRWIAAIQLFNFKLVHIPAEKHQGPDGLSCCEPIPGEDDNKGDPEEWVDDILSLGIWLDTWNERCMHTTHMAKVFQTTGCVSSPSDELTFPLPADRVCTLNDTSCPPSWSSSAMAHNPAVNPQKNWSASANMCRTSSSTTAVSGDATLKDATS